MDWKKHIISDQEVLLGKPTIRGTRISVELILELLSLGWTEEDILQSYPSLSKEQLKAVYAYLKDCMEHELFFPFERVE